MAEARLTFLDAGEAALVAQYGTIVDPAINDRVIALDAALGALKLEGIRETVPTYRSLMIHYDPLVIDRAGVVAAVRKADAAPGVPRAAASRWTIPCCYDPVFGEDLEAVAEMTGLSAQRVVELHSGVTYRVYMYGFAPGYCHLGGLPPELNVSRRTDPRPPMPSNAIMIAAGLSLIATFSMPTGWWILGRTPEDMFAPRRDPVFLVEVGDEIRFEAVDRTTHDELANRVAAGEIVARRERVR